jgi:DNA polymerase-3 subunit epsilon
MRNAMHTRGEGNRVIEYVFFDLETTGLDNTRHEIIEIGAVRTPADCSRELGTFSQKVIPVHPDTADPTAFEKNRYTVEEWRDAIPLRVALREFASFSAGGMLAAYNISFDWPFLDAALRAQGVAPTFDYHRFDVFSVALDYLHERGESCERTLSAMCKRFGIPAPVHRALGDARAAMRLLHAIRNERVARRGES